MRKKSSESEILFIYNMVRHCKLENNDEMSKFTLLSFCELFLCVVLNNNFFICVGLITNQTVQ